MLAATLVAMLTAALFEFLPIRITRQGTCVQVLLLGRKLRRTSPEHLGRVSRFGSKAKSMSAIGALNIQIQVLLLGRKLHRPSPEHLGCLSSFGGPG